MIAYVLVLGIMASVVGVHCGVFRLMRFPVPVFASSLQHSSVTGIPASLAAACTLAILLTAQSTSN